MPFGGAFFRKYNLLIWILIVALIKYIYEGMHSILIIRFC